MMDSRTHNRLKEQLVIMRKAKSKLSEYGYDLDNSNGQLTVQYLKGICKQLKESYKKIKPTVSKKEANEIKKSWKSIKKAVEKVGNSAAVVITTLLRWHGKKNLEDMQQATCEQNFNGWSKRYTNRQNENERSFFVNRFNHIEKIHESPYGQPLRPGAHLPIPDEIKSTVMRDWLKNHQTRYLRHVDIWNRYKRLDSVHGELLLKLAPDSFVTLCWAIPISVFEKSYRKRQLEEIRVEAEEAYNEAQKKAKREYESDSRVNDALVVYWYEKKKSSYVSPPYSDVVSDTLRGFQPDNFDEMVEDYKDYIQNLYYEAENDNGGYGDGPRELYHWKSWQTNVRADLRSLMEDQQKQDDEEKMREEEIERLEELVEEKRGYESC